jgi:NAD(P)-dependent dehydrogenase (short-subunit alcohol dehydrogenase family)
VDVLVNNAGIGDSSLLVDISVEAWDRMIAINLRNVFLCTRVVLPGMISRRWGVSKCRGNRPDSRPAGIRRGVLLHRRIAQPQRRPRHDLKRSRPLWRGKLPA